MRDMLAGAIVFSFLLVTNAGAASNVDPGKEGVYKGRDDDGIIIYSDKEYYEAKPYEEAKKIDPGPINVVDPVPVAPVEKNIKEEGDTGFRYISFRILSPTNDQFIWNEPDLAVKVQLKPELNTADGHTLWLLMDGKPWSKTVVVL